MAAYDLDQLLKLWATEKLTTEQAIGQLIQQLLDLDARIGQLERRMENLRQLHKEKGGKRP